MPKTSIQSPGTTGAVDRLTLMTSEARDEGAHAASMCSTWPTCMAEE
jgi:hypothetical protein